MIKSRGHVLHCSVTLSALVSLSELNRFWFVFSFSLRHFFIFTKFLVSADQTLVVLNAFVFFHFYFWRQFEEKCDFRVRHTLN